MTEWATGFDRRRQGRWWWRAVAVAVVVLAAAQAALAQSDDLGRLLDRIDRLERDIRTLNLQVSRGAPVAGAQVSVPAPPPATGAADTAGDYALARVEVRLNALEEEIRLATGRTEEVGHKLELINQRLDKLVGDVDFRLNAIENRARQPDAARPGDASVPATAPPSFGAAAAPVAPPPGPGILGTLPMRDAPAEKAGPGGVPGESAALPEGTPRDQYDHAFRLLRQQEYDRAEVALRAFVEAHPDDPLAANARYWLGETYYVRNQFGPAATTFFDAHRKDPTGAKAPDALLKLGMSLARLDKKREACATFDKLLKDFPNAPATIRGTAARERKSSGCS